MILFSVTASRALWEGGATISESRPHGQYSEGAAANEKKKKCQTEFPCL